MLKAMKEGRVFKKVASSEVASQRGDVKNNSFSIDVNGIEESLISEEEWKNKRRLILDQVITNATKSL